MTEAITLKYEHIGEVFFDPSRRARNLTIYIKSARRVRVAVPRGVTLARAKQVVSLRAEWIKQQQKRMAAREKQMERFEVPANLDHREAARGLLERLNYFAEKYNLPYNKVTIRNQKTRWGSCSSRNNINLNFRLVYLPAELVDYVLLHELTHTRVRNHSRVFWTQLEGICPGAKILNKRLRQYGYLFMEAYR